MNIAIIPAGGQGRRMGEAAGGRAKQFLHIDNVPVIVHTLRQFQKAADIDAILVALPTAELASGIFTELIQEYQLTKVLPPVEGSTERQGSIFCALQSLAASPLHEQTELVAIHDAVRPFISTAMISASLNAAREYGAAICALAATDTIKEVIDNKIVNTIPRTRIYLAQTPQTFRYQLILDAHRRAFAEDFIGTDDAMLVERLGQSVVVVEGSADNIKITKPGDLALAELILARQQDIKR